MVAKEDKSQNRKRTSAIGGLPVQLDEMFRTIMLANGRTGAM